MLQKCAGLSSTAQYQHFPFEDLSVFDLKIIVSKHKNTSIKIQTQICSMCIWYVYWPHIHFLYILVIFYIDLLTDILLVSDEFGLTSYLWLHYSTFTRDIVLSSFYVYFIWYGFSLTFSG